MRQAFFARIALSLSVAAGMTTISVAAVTGTDPVPAFAGTFGSQWFGAETNLSVPTGYGYAQLTGISCPSASTCLAVGYGHTVDAAPLVESLSGSTWTASSLSLPSGWRDGFLSSISCVSATSCVAVGLAASPVNGNQAFAEVLAGSTWTAIALPELSDWLNDGSGLTAVSCTSSTACVAVGYAFITGTQEPIAETLSGSTWTATDLPTVFGGPNLTGVDCLSATSCIAVGYLENAAVEAPVTETLSGSTWTVTKLSGTNLLTGLSCTLITSCVAVGEASGSALTPVVETLSGTTWTAANLPKPPGLPAAPIGIGTFGVSCISATSCLAVNTAGSPSMSFAETLSGTTWTANVLPGSGTSNLGAVSCPIAGPCVAVAGNTSAPPTAYIAPPYSVTPDGTNPGSDQNGGGGGADVACNCSTGDPVNPATGDFYDTKTDLTIPGAGIPLTFSRTYDADAAQAAESTTASAGPLGYGWSDNLGMSVSYNGGTGLATVTQANGSQVPFQHFPQGAAEPVGSTGVTWCPSDATAAVFCPTAPRYIATLAQGVGGTWTFINDVRSPITYSFTSAGALSEIADAAGDTLTGASYAPGGGQASCPSGDTCTAWSSTPSGASTPSAVLVEAFDASAQLVAVFDAASGAATTQVVTFAYTGSGCSTWSGTPVDLCSVTDPGSRTTTFTYDTSKATPYQYDETAMNPPATGAVTNTYNATGQVSEQVIGTGGTSEEQTFAYATNSSVTNGTQTSVTSYPNGSGGTSSTTTYLYSNEVEVGEINAAGATTYVLRDPATLRALQTIDPNDHAVSDVLDNYGSGGTPTTSANATLTTDASGNTIQTAYTAVNLAWCAVDAANYANGTRCPASAPTSPPAAGTYIGYTLDIYNSANKPLSVTDPLGNTTSTSYAASGLGVPANLPYCTVDPVDYSKGVVCPTYGSAHVTGTASKTFDASGDVLTATDANGNTTSYAYGSAANPGLPTLTTNPDGTKTSDTYDAAGEVLTQVVSGTTGTYSATTQYAYDPSGRKFCEVGAYEYSLSVRCPGTPPITPPTGTPGYTDSIYNADGQVTLTTNPMGGITQSAYDGSGNKYCTVSPANYALSKRCPTLLPLTIPTVGSDLYLGATITTFDGDNRVVQATNALGGITLSQYDLAGNLTRTTVKSDNGTSAPDVVTASSYDANNRVISATNGFGSTSPATSLTFYDPNGSAFCTVSAKVVALGTSAYQCPTWQSAWVVTPPSPTALYSPTPTASQANNVTTSFANAVGTQMQTTNPNIQTTISAADADGRTYCTSDPVNVASWLTAHSTSAYPYLCPTAPPTTAPTGTITGYSTTLVDATGRTLSTTDPVGDTTSSSYDPSGHTLTTTDPQGKVTTNCYYWQSGTGQCAAGAPSNGGSLDDLYSVTTPATTADPSGMTTTHTYVLGENSLATTTPAGTTTDSYNANVNPTGVTFSGTASGYSTPTNQSYVFNADGTRSSMTDATGTTTYSYDANGATTQQQFTAGSGTGLANKTVAYGYFATGVQSSLTYPTYGTHTNPQATYTYDALGNMASATDWLGNTVAFAHDGDGNLTAQNNAVSTPNPTGTSSTAYAYDNAGLNTQAASTLNCSGTNGTLTQSFSGTGGSRNPDGQVTQDAQTYAGACAGPATYQRNYTYDQAGRVVYQGSATQGANPNNVAYDTSGDPTTISSHDTSGNFDTYTQAVDNTGAVTSQTPISGSHGSASTYATDTLGDRTSTTTGSTTTSYGFNQVGQMASTSPSGSSYLYSGDGLQSAATGPSWGAATSVDSTKVLNSVSCASSTFCEAVDANGNALNYNGATWSAASSIDSTHAIDSVSCPTSSFCEAVDNAGRQIKYSGSWLTGSSIDGTRVVNSVSCVSSTFCEAVDSAGRAMKFTGTWAGGATVDGTKNVTSVSCASTTLCMAVDASGNAIKYTGTWGAATSIDGTKALKSVSCPTTSFCEAVDGSGNALTYNGTTWSAAVAIDGTTAIKSVSCASSTSCQAVDTSGNALGFNGATWTTAASIDGTKAVDGVSCVSSTLCTAVDNGGSALLYKVAVTNQLLWDSNSSLPLVLADSTNHYIYGPTGEPVEMVNTTSSPPANNPQFMTYTPSDSSWLITNAAGNQTSFYRYDAFGNLAQGTPGSRFGYSGQYADASTGLVNDRARFYDSQTGGFTTRDPAFSSTDTAYTYAGGDPVNKTDPSGQCVLGIFGNCGPTEGATTSGVWATVHPKGLWSANIPNDNLAVYLPFYNDVNSKASLGQSLGSLWFGLYQHGDQSTVNTDGSVRLADFQSAAQQFTSNPSECSTGIDSADFACSVSNVLVGYQSAGTGAPGIQAYDYFLQQGERSLAYLVYANSANSTLNQLYLGADDLLQNLYSRAARGKFSSYAVCDSNSTFA